MSNDLTLISVHEAQAALPAASARLRRHDGASSDRFYMWNAKQYVSSGRLVT